MAITMAIKIILVISFNFLWFKFIYGVDLSMFYISIQFVVKGLILAMINIAIMHKELSVKGLILYCIMPFIIGVLLYYYNYYNICILTYYISTVFIEFFNEIFITHQPLNGQVHA